MVRISDMLLVAAVISGAVWTYQIKHEADLSAKRLASLNQRIAAQNSKIALLEADFAITTGPARLEAIARQFEGQLALKPIESTQIIDLSELPPMRQKEDPLQEMIAGEIDTTITGSVETTPKLVPLPTRRPAPRKPAGGASQ